MKIASRCHYLLGMAFIALLLALMAPPIMAQSQNISGTVVDESGAVIPDASILITDAVKGGTARKVTTDETGRFQAIGIQPGRYVISVEKAGFKKVEMPITLDVNTRLDVGSIKLQV